MINYLRTKLTHFIQVHNLLYYCVEVNVTYISLYMCKYIYINNTNNFVKCSFKLKINENIFVEIIKKHALSNWTN